MRWPTRLGAWRLEHTKGLELACRIAPDVPQVVVGDAGRLRQVLVNLVGNAIKFTEVGEVVLDVATVSQSGDEIKLRFSVTDTGIGVPFAKRQSIFNAFEQADGSTTRKYGGTGLGLTISSRLVELMGGGFGWITSPKRGASFDSRQASRPKPVTSLIAARPTPSG